MGIVGLNRLVSADVNLALVEFYRFLHQLISCLCLGECAKTASVQSLCCISGQSNTSTTRLNMKQYVHYYYLRVATS